MYFSMPMEMRREVRSVAFIEEIDARDDDGTESRQLLELNGLSLPLLLAGATPKSEIEGNEELGGDATLSGVAVFQQSDS